MISVEGLRECERALCKGVGTGKNPRPIVEKRLGNATGYTIHGDHQYCVVCLRKLSVPWFDQIFRPCLGVDLFGCGPAVLQKGRVYGGKRSK